MALFYLLSFLVRSLSPLAGVIEADQSLTYLFRIAQISVNIIIYCIAAWRKSNTFLGNARVAGLEKDLKLTDKQYQIAVTVLYV